MPSTHPTFAWTQFTWVQIEALLKVAAAVDRQPQELNRHLPTVGERAAFRGAVTVLSRLKTAAEEVL